jgi:hypothetical protein
MDLQLESQHLSYTVPKIDKYKNKFVLKGSVTYTSGNQPIRDVLIYLDNNILIATADQNGFFQIALDLKYKNWAIIFRKKGFETTAVALDGINKDIIELFPSLKQK